MDRKPGKQSSTVDTGQGPPLRSVIETSVPTGTTLAGNATPPTAGRSIALAGSPGFSSKTLPLIPT